MISKLFLVAILVAMAFADHTGSSSEEDVWAGHHLHWHIIPKEEAAAKEWSEKAHLPWEQTRKIMDIRHEAKQTTNWTDRLQKLREVCEYITTTPELDVSQWTEPETWKQWKKTWIDQTLKMAHWIDKMKTAQNEREKITLLKKACWEMLN